MLFTSPFPDIQLPVQDLPSFLFSYAETRSCFNKDQNQVAITDSTSTLTYAKLKQQSSMLASGLVNNLQLHRGDVIAILLPNSVYFPVVILGALMAGQTCALANPAYTVDELAHFLKLVNASAVITLTFVIPRVSKALAIAKKVVPHQRIVTIDKSSGSNIWQIMTNKPYNCIKFTSLEEAQNTPAFILQSSGTTGLPKGVLLSHANIVCQILQCISLEAHDPQIANSELVDPHQSRIACLPFFHSYGLVLVLLTSLAKGHHQVVMKRFELERFCQLVEMHRAAAALLVPPIIIQLAKNPIVDKYDVSSLVFINSGAAPLTRETQLEVQRRLGCHVTQTYGLSETSPSTHRSLSNAVRMGSSGHLFASMQCKIVDKCGRSLNPMQIGEICVRGPNVMMGYLNNLEATAETIRDGFLHTGDIGYVDNDGFYFIVDRKKELIKYKGFQVAPAELEGLLLDHPAILDAAVIPVLDSSQETEVPRAFVVIKSTFSKHAIADEVKAWIAARVSPYKRLRGGVEVVRSIPKSASGKILRRVLKAQYGCKPKL